MDPRWGVVLVAAGAGTRFGAPKGLVRLGGVTLLERSAAVFADVPDRVAVLREADLATIALPGWKKVAGGARRRDSVAAGLDALAPGTRYVLVHDAARPLVTPDIVARVREMVERVGAAIPVIPLADTIKKVDGGLLAGTLPRAELGAAQTPQGFEVGLLRRAFAAAPGDATDDAALVEALGAPVAAVAGDPRNLKITTPLDLLLAAAILAGDHPASVMLEGGVESP